MTSGPDPQDDRLSRGYPADLDYTAGFFPETAPSRLAFAALVAGGDSGPAARPRRMLELGFGQGFGLALLAAANPDIRFEGCDFNPAHVAHARGLADAAGLENLEVSAASFEALAAAPGAEADCDVIVAHGVMSWVSAETRAAVVEVVRRRLRPGGLFHVSYNCSPGQAPAAPLRDLFRSVAARTEGSPVDQARSVQTLLRTLRDGGAGYIVRNPAVAARVEEILAADPVYLAHEYLGEHWRVFTIAEMTALLEPADLRWLCSANLTDDLPNLTAPAPLLPLLRSVDGDVLWRETLKDIACNRSFRHDVFVRAADSEDAPAAELADVQFVLTTPVEEVSLTFSSSLGQLEGAPTFYRPLVEQLAAGARSFGELLASPVIGGRREIALECLCLLVQSGQVAAVLPGRTADPAPAQRFNAELISRARTGRFYTAFACPSTGGGLPTSDIALLALAALEDGCPRDVGPLTDAVETALTRLGRSVHEPLTTESGVENPELVALVSSVGERRLPLWSRLGALPVSLARQTTTP